MEFWTYWCCLRREGINPSNHQQPQQFIHSLHSAPVNGGSTQIWTPFFCESLLIFATAAWNSTEIEFGRCVFLVNDGEIAGCIKKSLASHIGCERIRLIPGGLLVFWCGKHFCMSFTWHFCPCSKSEDPMTQSKNRQLNYVEFGDFIYSGIIVFWNFQEKPILRNWWVKCFTSPPTSCTSS